jgi:hypothetical protein
MRLATGQPDDQRSVLRSVPRHRLQHAERARSTGPPPSGRSSASPLVQVPGRAARDGWYRDRGSVTTEPQPARRSARTAEVGAAGYHEVPSDPDRVQVRQVALRDLLSGVQDRCGGMARLNCQSL